MKSKVYGVAEAAQKGEASHGDSMSGPSPPIVMKNVQVRLADEVHETLKILSQIRGISLADVVREALEVYTISIAYAQEGKRLMWEDPKTGEKVEVRIPGLLVRDRKGLLAALLGRGKRSA